MKYSFSKYKGVYVRYKSNNAKPPKFYWIVREFIPASISHTKKPRYQDYYACPNTQAAALKLQKQVSLGRPSYPKGRKLGTKMK